jgi:hypothetical protein
MFISVKVAVDTLEEKIIIFVLNVDDCSSLSQPFWSGYETSCSVKSVQVSDKTYLE